MIVVVLLVTLATLLAAAMLCVTHVRSTGKRLSRVIHRPESERAGWKDTDTFRSTVTVQNDRHQMMLEWFRLVSNAKNTVLMSTYHWVTHRYHCDQKSESEVSPHVITLGLALRECQSRRGRSPQVTLMMVKDPWVPPSRIASQITHSLAVWRGLGVDLSRISFRCYHQQIADNMHIKILAVDHECVNVSSGNVQYEIEHDRPEDAPERKVPQREGENSVTVYDRGLVKKIERFVLDLNRLYRDYSYLKDAVGTLPRYAFSGESRVLWYDRERGEPRLALGDCLSQLRAHEPTFFPGCATDVLLTRPKRSLWNASWDKDYDPLLGSIRQAREEIIVMTPNFSDVTVWAELKGAMRRGVAVTIVTGERFNDKGTVAKYLTGMRSNRDMFRTHCLPFMRQDPHGAKLSWYWYGYGGEGALTTSPRCGHHKLMLVDRRVSITGSLNFHVFGFYNVSEIMVRVDSRGVYEKIYRELVANRLRHALPADPGAARGP